MIKTRQFIICLLTALLFATSCAGVPRGRTTELHAAIDSGDIASVIDLIEDAKIIDARDESGRTALHHAAISGDLSATAALLDAGADPNLFDTDGRTSLHYAVLSCNADLVAMLLAADTDASIVDENDATALELAKSSGCKEAEDTIVSASPDFIPKEL